MRRLFIPLLLLLLAGGCQLAPPTPPVAVVPPAPVKTWFEKLQDAAASLPAAQVSSGAGSMTIAYPQESLFSLGSVLPLAGGAEALDPLATLLRTHPEAIWEAKVQATTSNGTDYDLALAEKRRELLQRYLRHAGVAENQVLWQATAGNGIPLQLTLRPLQPAAGSSSGVKE